MPKKSSELREKIHAMHEENEYKSILDNRSRARSVTVGTAFGGTIEIIMRNEFSVMYGILQPVEAVELMEQIAAGCGIEVAMRPKQNFTSWRGWSIDSENSNDYVKGSSPYQIESQEFNRKIQALHEDMRLEIELARIQVEKEKEIKKIRGSSSEEPQKLLPDDKKVSSKKPRSPRKKSISKLKETEVNDEQ